MVNAGGNDRGGRGGRRARKASPRGSIRRSSPGKSSGSQASPPPTRELPKVPRNVTFADDIPPHCVRGEECRAARMPLAPIVHSY
jgi:hypothetical protein